MHTYYKLPGVGITSKICLLTVTLADLDNPSSDALLSDNSSNSQEMFLMARWGVYSARARLVSKSHNQSTNMK